MTRTSRPSHTCKTFIAATTALLLTACTSTAVRVGGTPDTAVKNCIAAAAKELKVPASSVDVASNTAPSDNLYAVNLRIGASGRSAVCTVDENGAVLGVVYKRPE